MSIWRCFMRPISSWFLAKDAASSFNFFCTSSLCSLVRPDISTSGVISFDSCSGSSFSTPVTVCKSQRSRVRIPYKPEFFFTLSFPNWKTAMIYFRIILHPAVHIYDFLIFITSSSSFHGFTTNQFNDLPLMPVGLLAGLPRAFRTERHTHGIWSTSFRLVVTWLTERTYVRVYRL